MPTRAEIHVEADRAPAAREGMAPGGDHGDWSRHAEDAAVGAALAYGEVDGFAALGAAAAVGGAIGGAVDAEVDVAAVELDADVGAVSRRRRSIAGGVRVGVGRVAGEVEFIVAVVPHEAAHSFAWRSQMRGAARWTRARPRARRARLVRSRLSRSAGSFTSGRLARTLWRAQRTVAIARSAQTARSERSQGFTRSATRSTISRTE